VPQHGTLLKVAKDGGRTEILATGFRAPNGVCLNADGTFFLSDQEGFWTPKNRINWVKRNGFYGNMWGYSDVTDPADSAMEQPVCWLTNAFDRSPAQLLWVESTNPAWKPLEGALLCLSYGYGKIYVVPHELVAGQMQGGECALPLPRFPTGIMRGRFHPGNGELYTCGLFAWAGDQTEPGGFYRVRATGKPMHLPVQLNVREGGVLMRFTDPLDPQATINASAYSARAWSIKRSVEYGSEHYGEHALEVKSASLSEDGRGVWLGIPGIHPTRCMELRYQIRGKSGAAVNGVIDCTIHRLGDGRARTGTVVRINEPAKP
jgi:hypothetical protein